MKPTKEIIMNVRREVIALIVRILANETPYIRKDEPSDVFFNHLFGVETQEQQVTRYIEVALDEATETAKRVNLNRKFKKIVRHVEIKEESPN